MTSDIVELSLKKYVVLELLSFISVLKIEQYLNMLRSGSKLFCWMSQAYHSDRQICIDSNSKGITNTA